MERAFAHAHVRGTRMCMCMGPVRGGMGADELRCYRRNHQFFPNKNTDFISIFLGKYERFYSDFSCRKNAIADNQ